MTKVTMDNVKEYFSGEALEDLCDYCGCKHFINFKTDLDAGGELEETAKRYEHVRDRTYKRIDYYCSKLDKDLGNDMVDHCESYEAETKE